MKLLEKDISQTFNEHYIVETFNLNNKVILELGCGAASMTKKIADTGYERKVIAYEVDALQHEKNLNLKLDNVEFVLSGAQNILQPDSSVDAVFMFKSFHHIPKDLMPKALEEIKRVLKPGGLAYISEPLFQGQQNELIAMFHDEEQVRIDAFEAIKTFVDKHELKLFKEMFFYQESAYENFDDFKRKQMNLSYNDDNISKELEDKIKAKYLSFANKDESAYFLKPFRVDILQK